MTKDTLLLLFGVCIALLPFLGFPHQWDTFLLVILGVSVAAIGVVLRRDKRGMNAPASPTSPEQTTAIPEHN